MQQSKAHARKGKASGSNSRRRLESPHSGLPRGTYSSRAVNGHSIRQKILAGSANSVAETLIRGLFVRPEHKSATSVATRDILVRFAVKRHRFHRKRYACRQSGRKQEKSSWILSEGTGCKARYVKVEVNSMPVFAKVDRGAEVCVLPAKFPGIPTKLDKVQ